MEQHTQYDYIKKLIDEGRLTDALLSISTAIEKYDDDATLFYLKGNAYMKMSDWPNALQCFLQSEKLDPTGKAAESRQMLEDILNFFNKDMYNQ